MNVQYNNHDYDINCIFSYITSILSTKIRSFLRPHERNISAPAVSKQWRSFSSYAWIKDPLVKVIFQTCRPDTASKLKRVSLSSMGRKASRRLPVSLFARVVFHSSSLDSIGKPSSGLTFKNSSLEPLYLKSKAAYIYVVIKRIKEGIALFRRES